MRKQLSTLAVIFALILAAPSSFAATKDGGICKKQGAIQLVGGKSYTCVKQGKKLIWVVKERVSLPTPMKKSQAITQKRWTMAISQDVPTALQRLHPWA